MYHEIQEKIFKLEKLKPDRGKDYTDVYKKNVDLILNELGSITITSGHSRELDSLKNQTWKLIRL